jgi:purine-binding chemotaxis protein CheW
VTRNGISPRAAVAPSPVAAQERLARLRSAGNGVAEFLSFRVGTEIYAFPLAAVREILRVLPITEVPRAPREVLGVLSVRGRVTTVVDMRRKLGAPEGLPTRSSRVLLVDAGDEVLGALVDEVQVVHRLLPEEIEPAGRGQGDLSEHVLGLGRPRTAHRVNRAGREQMSMSETLLVLLDPVQLFRR